MIKERAVELVAALRSGEYKQCNGALRGGSGYCCLGVACDISGLGRWVDHGAEIEYVIGDGDDETMVLPARVREHFGIRSTNGATEGGVMIAVDGVEYGCLSEANDAGVTFEKLADWIETNWERL